MATVANYSSSSLSTLRKPALYPTLSPGPHSIRPPLPFPSPITHLSLNLKCSGPTTPIRIKTPSSAAASDFIAASAPETLKSRLRNGETLYGIFLLSFSPTLAEIAGLSGYDFAVVDMEHGPGGISDALPCLHALAATNTAAILRIPESSATWAKKALDLGPQGIMFPMIDSREAAQEAVSYCRFPPNGVRGSAHTVVRASGYGIDEGYLSNYEEELLIMCQIECGEGVKRAKEIAAVDGVDCIQMGPLDLSASLGYLWDPGHKKVREVMRAAEKAVLAESKPPEEGGAYLAGFAMPHDSGLDLKARGYHMVSGAVDVGLFRTAAVEDVKKFWTGLAEGGSSEGVEDDKNGDEKYWSE